MPREELLQRFVSVEFNRFLSYYKDAGDLNYSEERVSKARKGNVSFLTFRLGIGYVNDLNKRDLMRYINGLRVTRGIEIGQINIFETHCFVELDAEYESQLLKAFARNNYRGVPVEAQVSEKRRPERQKPDRTWKKKGPRKDY
jgi:ATP-dependent RNA helicase DeaD